MKQLFLPSAAGLAGIMGLVFAIFSFYTISSSKDGKSKCMCFLLVLSISVLVSGMIVVRYQGRPEAVAALYAAHAVHMVLYCLMLGAFVAYLRRALGLQPRQWRWQSICIYIALALLILLGATNPLHRQILTISPQTGLETPQSLYPIVSVAVCLILGLCLYKVTVHRKRYWQSGVALGFFCISHILVVLMQLYWGGGSGADLTSLFAILVLYASFYFEENQKYAQQEQELQNARAALVLSQIQPHFLFNSLAVVMDLCDTEPKEAKAALQELSDYLHYKKNGCPVQLLSGELCRGYGVPAKLSQAGKAPLRPPADGGIRHPGQGFSNPPADPSAPGGKRHPPRHPQAPPGGHPPGQHPGGG